MKSDQGNQELVEDLERRIETLQELDEAEFGTFTRSDYIMLLIFSLVLPVIALVMAS